jgi:hypothetical protein
LGKFDGDSWPPCREGLQAVMGIQWRQAGERMQVRTGRPAVTLGFLTIVENAEHGIFGGFLVLNSTGRPLEFHCTTPVKPNRAQEILYGPTLRPYLYGEQIAPTLISKASHTPGVVCTDLPDALVARAHVDPPLVLVLEKAEQENPAEAPRVIRLDSAHALSKNMATFDVGRQTLAVAQEHVEDRETVLARLASLGEFDLCEPFARIREAIEEAQRGSR